MFKRREAEVVLISFYVDRPYSAFIPVFMGKVAERQDDY